MSGWELPREIAEALREICAHDANPVDTARALWELRERGLIAFISAREGDTQQ